PCPCERIQNSIRVVDLIDRRRPFRAVPSAASGMIRIALELPDLHRLLIDVTEQPATRLAVEARRRDDHVVLLFASLSALRLVLPPLVPLLLRRVTSQ